LTEKKNRKGRGRKEGFLPRPTWKRRGFWGNAPVCPKKLRRKRKIAQKIPIFLRRGDSEKKGGGRGKQISRGTGREGGGREKKKGKRRRLRRPP